MPCHWVERKCVGEGRHAGDRHRLPRDEESLGTGDTSTTRGIRSTVVASETRQEQGGQREVSETPQLNHQLHQLTAPEIGL